MSAIRTLANNSFRRTEPFNLILGTIASVGASYLLIKILSGEAKDLKKTLFKFLFKAVRAIPGAEGKIKSENQKVLAKMEKDMDVLSHIEKIRVIPETGLSAEEILKRIQDIQIKDAHWQTGRCSGVVYNASQEHFDLLNKAYCLNSIANPLHPDAFPSIRRMETEIISMTAAMLGSSVAPNDICGAMTSGGTESILMAIKSYRDRARELQPHIEEPEIVVAASAHPAFDKGCAYFGVKIIHVPVRKDGSTDVPAMRRAITNNTILIVGSAPSFPHGIIDPIEELAAVAKEFKIGLHVDCCLGGFFLPWLKKIRNNIPNFDFTVDGVTTISADTHKYGYASKGTSVVLFRTKELRKYMYFVQTEWIGGVYASPTVSGSRPGGLVAACWASLVHMGQEGFIKQTERIANAADRLREGIAKIPGLYVIGEPKAMIVAFASKDFDVYKIVDALKPHGWHLNILQNPNSLHFCLTANTVQYVDEFLKDLEAAAKELKADPSLYKDGVAPIYGLASSLPERTVIKDIVTGLLDTVLKL